MINMVKKKKISTKEASTAIAGKVGYRLSNGAIQIVTQCSANIASASPRLTLKRIFDEIDIRYLI
jgi:hypothetical protein